MHRILNLNLNKPITPYAGAMFQRNHNNNKRPQSLGRGERVSPHLTQSRVGRGLPLYQVASWSMQPFGRNRYELKIGGGGAGSPSNTMWPWPRPTCVPSFILIRPTVWPECTNVTDRQTGQDRQTANCVKA